MVGWLWHIQVWIKEQHKEDVRNKVKLEDRELAGFTAAEPDSVDAIARAVTADSLARQRQLVLTRLRRMGVDVIEAPHDKLGFAVIDRYLALRAQEAIAG